MEAKTFVLIGETINTPYSYEELVNLSYLITYKKGSKIISKRIKHIEPKQKTIVFRDYDTNKKQSLPYERIVDILDFDKYFGLNGWD